MKYWKDVWNVCLHEAKLIINNRLSLFILGVFVVVFFTITTGMKNEYQNGSSIPIGVFDEEQSELSKNVVNQLKECDGFTLHQNKESELKELLKEGKIYAYFVIKDGFEERLQQGDFKALIRMVYLRGNQYISIVSDVFAKNMVNEVIAYEGKLLYEELEKEYGFVKKAEYVKYVSALKKDYEESFSFLVEYYDVSDTDLLATQQVENQLLSKQVLVGIISMMLSFLTFFFLYLLRERRIVRKRIRLSLLSDHAIMFGEIGCVFVIMSLVNFLCSIYFVQLFQISQIGKLLLLMAFFEIAILNIYQIISVLCKKNTIYQFTGTLTILILGGCAVLGTIGEIQIPYLLKVSKFIPNYWLISGITDIIVGKSVSFYREVVILPMVCIIVYIIIYKIKENSERY